MKLLQLLFTHFTRSLIHGALRTLVLGKCNNIPNALCAGHQHDNPVQRKDDPPVRRGTVSDSIQHKTELVFSFLFPDSETVTYLALPCLRVESYCTPTDFVSVLQRT